jgi:hypothetical protein
MGFSALPPPRSGQSGRLPSADQNMRKSSKPSMATPSLNISKLTVILSEGVSFDKVPAVDIFPVVEVHFFVLVPAGGEGAASHGRSGLSAEMLD